MIVRKPGYPLAQLVTFELRNYRDRLESALASFPVSGNPAERELMRQRLAEVISEQEARTRPSESQINSWASR